jgi:xylulokinase
MCPAAVTNGGIPGSALEVLVAIDVGTSGARASAFDISGAPLCQARRSYPTFLPAEGRAEQDGRRWQAAALSALGGLVRQLGTRSRILGIGVTGQCPSVVPVDAAGLPLRPGIIYRDNRAAEEAEWMCRKVGTTALHALTGHVPAAFHVGPKILWLRSHEPDVFSRTRWFLQPTDYVVLALTGETSTDWTMAAATALLDLRARRWAADLLADLDLDPRLLPPIRPSWSVTGHLRPALSRRLRLPAQVPVVAGAGDSIACAVGAGVTAPGPVSEMAGSSTCLNSVVSEPVEDEEITHYPSSIGEHGYLTEVGINTTGEAVDWLVQLAYSGPSRRPTGADYARLDSDAATTKLGAHGLLFVPVLGDGERDDPGLRGAVTGLSLRHDRRALGRALLEGIAFSIRARLETLARVSDWLTELRVSGGGASIDSWNRIKADVLGVPVTQVRGDATAAGAAMLAGIGIGVYRDAAEATAAGFHSGPQLEPDADNHELYNEIYARYRALVGSPVVRIRYPSEL